MKARQLWVLFVLLGLSGCQLFGWRGSGENESHRTVWASHSAGNYSMVMHRSCFCFPAGVFNVEVADYRIVSMTDRGSGEAIDSTQFEWVHTIEQLFDLIDEARRQPADLLEVEYAREGYPTLVNIDWWRNAADDEIYYAISDVVVK